MYLMCHFWYNDFTMYGDCA